MKRLTPGSLALQAFEASARHLSFTHAAVELCVTQGAISLQVAQLEAQLGVALFARLRHAVATDRCRSRLFDAHRAGVARTGRRLHRIDDLPRSRRRAADRLAADLQCQVVGAAAAARCAGPSTEPDAWHEWLGRQAAVNAYGGPRFDQIQC
jgi:hypothetical protein